MGHHERTPMSRLPRGGVRGLFCARPLGLGAPLAGLALLLVLLLKMEGPTPLRRQACWGFLWDYEQDAGGNADSESFEGFDNETGAVGAFPAPNVVHFIRMAQPEFTFLEYVCVVAAWERQQPDWIMFHTDLLDFRGEYWKRLQATPGLREVIQLVPTQQIWHVHGQPLDGEYGRWHAGDVLRIAALQKYGGIYLDNDVILLRSLDPLRRFEMALGWPLGFNIGTQALVAHPAARFLRAWLESYRAHYVGTLWYYNAGQRPTQLVLQARPELVHRVPDRLGVAMSFVASVYQRKELAQLHADGMYAVHLFQREAARALVNGGKAAPGQLEHVTEENICGLDVTLLQMAKEVLPRLCSGS